MRELRLLPSERVPDSQVQGKRRQPFHRARDMRNAHVVVIDDMRQVIGRESIRFQQNRILQLRIVEFDLSSNQVMPHSLAREWHLESNHVGTALRFQFCAGLRWQISITPIIAAARLAHLRQFFGCSKAFVGVTAFHQPTRAGLIQLQSL